jgi:hypothetical protein
MTTVIPTIEQAASKAADIAMMGAAEYLRTHDLLPLSDEDLGIVIDYIRVELKASLREALDDAAEALDCGMVEAGVMTFKLSMELAGVRAAQRFEEGRG